ncbi:MAG: OadG family transporter subunit [Cellulosilyticaceae bacterium]
MSERITAFIDGLSTFLIGVTMVFVALVLLILLIKILGKVVTSLENKKVSQVATKVDVPVVTTPVVEEVVNSSQEVDELELVAVITAVIAASLGTTSDKLQVRSLRRVDRRSRTFE